MSIWQDLLELGARTVAITLCFVLIFLTSLEYTEEILIVLSKYLLHSTTNNSLILFSYSSIIEGSSGVYTIANLTSIIITYPFILLQLFFFIKNGLYLYEKRKVIKNIRVLILYHFIFNILFFSFLLPFILANLNELGEEFSFNTVSISIEIDLSDYLMLVKDIFVFNYFIGYVLLTFYYLLFNKIVFILGRKINCIIILILNFLILYIIQRFDLVLIVGEFLLNYFILQELFWFFKKDNFFKKNLVKFGRSRIRTHDCF